MIIPGYSLFADVDAKGKLQPRDVYLAGPFFTDEQTEEMTILEDVCREPQVTFFSPRLECRYRSKEDPPIVAQRAFALNGHHIRHCSLVVASLTWPDVGTAWELGYADALGIPRLGVTSKSKMKTNLMVAGTVDFLVDLEDACHEISTYFADVARYGRVSSTDRLRHRAALCQQVEGMEME